jgi:hypothetical protein
LWKEEMGRLPEAHEKEGEARSRHAEEAHVLPFFLRSPPLQIHRRRNPSLVSLLGSARLGEERNGREKERNPLFL